MFYHSAFTVTTGHGEDENAHSCACEAEEFGFKIDCTKKDAIAVRPPRWHTRSLNARACVPRPHTARRLAVLPFGPAFLPSFRALRLPMSLFACSATLRGAASCPVLTPPCVPGYLFVAAARDK